MFQQIINIPVNKKNEGILFPDNVIPSSRPLHIYRKTGARCVSNLGTCTISDKPLKMLGKNQNGVFIPQDRCRYAVSTPYYPNYNNYVHRKCMPSLTPMYTIFNPNNDRFRTQGAVSSSAFAALKKYEAIIANNQSLLNTYKINVRYSENPIHTLKDDVAFTPQNNYQNCRYYNKTSTSC